ncbi:TPA: YSIRK-type signal peptide-containing protein, partial [Streptococcus suis]
MLDKKKIKFRRKRQVTPDKRYRYSIRKFNVGIASVAIAAFMFLGGGAVSVSASELESVVPANTSTSLESGELAQPSPETPVAEEEVAETAPVSPAPSSSEPAQSVPAPAPVPNSEPVQSVPAPAPASSSEPAQSVPAPAPAPSSDSQLLAATDDLAAAKKVLEQVTSEAEVLSSDALRKAAKSTDDTSALQEAATATQAVIAVANKVFADEKASLEEVNAQIAAIRASVEALANQLYSSTASQDLSVMLTTGTPDTTTPAHYTKIINDVASEPYAITARELGTTTPAVTSFNLAVYDAATGTSVYKRYDTNSPMNMTLILQDYKANASSFLTADAFKAAHPLGENETIYVVNKADLENAPAPTTLTFPGLHHREHIVYDPAKQQYYYFLAADVLKLHFEERGKNLLTANIYWKNLIANHSGVAILKSDKLDPNLLISHTADKPTKHGLHDMGDIYDIEFETEPNFDDWKTTDAEGDLYANYGTNKTIKWRYVQKNQEGQVILREENWRETTVHVGYVNTRDKNDQTIYLSDTTNPDGYVEASKIISEQPYVDYTFTGRTPQNVYSDTQVTTKVVYNDFANYKANGMDFSKLPEPIRDELFQSELAVPGPRGTLPKDGEMVFDPYFKPRKSLEGYPANYLNAFNGEVIKYDGQGAGGNRDTTSDADNPKELDPTQTFPEQIYSERDYPFTEAIFGSKISIDDDGNLKAGTDPLTDTNVADYPLYDRYDSLYSPKYDTNNYWEYVIDSVPRTEIISDGTKINLAAIDAAVVDVNGSVFADYIALDDQGNVTDTKLQETKTIINQQPKDTDYALHDGDKKPETFEHNGRTYKLVYSTLKVKGTDTAYSDTGKVVKGNINATHYYAPVQEKTIEKPLEATLRVEYYDDDTNLKFPQLPNGIVHKTGVVGKTYYKQSYYLDKEKREVALSEVKLYNEVTQGVAYDLVNDKVTDPAGITAGLNTTLNPDLTWEGMRNTGDPATSGENTLLYLYHSKITFEGVNTTKGEFYSDSVVKLYYSMDGDNPTGTTYDRTADDRGTLIIRYVDEEGNQLAEPYTHKDNLVVGTSSYKVNEVETAWDEGGSATAWAIAEDVRYDEVYVSKNIPYDVHRDQKTDGTAVKPDQIREYRFLRPEAKIPLSGSLLRGVHTITLVYTKTYQVRHRFEKATSVPAHIQLPTEIATRTNGKDYTDVASGDSRTPNDTIDKTAYVDNVNNGTWTFEAWDKSTVTVGKDNPNPEFVGTWLFTANTPPPASPTGSVKIVYKALTADGSAEDTNVTLRAEVNDTVDAAVGSPWNAKETNVDHDKDTATDPIDERPATLLTAATPDKASLQYKLVSEKTTIQKPTDPAPVLVTSDTELEGQVVEGLTTITYYYKPVLGGVIVKYVNEAGDEIADQYTDTDLNTHLTSPVQSYDATQTKPNSTDSEKPLTLTGKDGKSYIFKEVRAEAGDSQPSGNLKEGTTTVVYVYSEKPKGSVLVRYKALDAETGRQEDNSVTLRADYLDTPETYVDTAWSTVDKNVDHDKNQDTPLVDEQPTKFENINDKDYVLVKTVTQVPGQDAASDATSGRVVQGQTVVTYFYAPVQTETATTENKGSVVIEYRRLGDKKEIASAKDDRRDVVVSTTTTTKTFYVVDGQRTYLEGGEAGVTKTVPTAADQLTYTANETGEQPPTINFQDTDAGETAEKTYHFVKHDETSADITGSVEVGTKTVVYLYSPEQSEPTSKDNTAKVTVNYYILGTSTELQPSYEDTPATKISETVSTRTYYLDADGNQVPVGDPTVVTNPVNPEVTYDTTLTKADGTAERPTTLTSGGKTYHLVETATSFTDGTGVSGTLTKDTVVNYYYAEVKEEEVSRTPITGNVLVHYKRASDKQELKGTYTDTPATPVAYTVVTRSYYEDAQGQKHQVGESRSSREAVTPVPTYTVEGTTEAPATLRYENTTYHYIGLETGSKPLTGDVVEGTTEVTLLYSPEMTVSTPSDNSAKVTVNYYILGTSTELQPSYEDTPVTKISETVSTRTYYLGADGNQVPVGDPTVVTNPVNPAVTYDTTETKNGKEERPTTLTSGGKTYHLVETATSFTDGTGVSGTLTKDTVVNYYYAEVKEEEVSRTPITGNVLVHYKRASDKQELKGTYTDTPATPVAYTVVTRSYYEDAQGVKHQVGESRTSREAVSPIPTYTVDGTAEVPTTLPYENTTYHYIGLETGSKPLTGDVVEGTTEVTLLYSPEVTVSTPSDNSAKVTVNYYILGTDTTLQPSYEDTPATKISETVSTRTYYLDADGNQVPVGDPTVVTNPVNPEVTYDTTETKNGKEERPTTLTSGGKTYHLVETATSFTDGTGVSGTLTKDTVVNYYYAEVKEEVTTVPTNGSVTIKYETVDGEELQTPFSDTPSTEISSVTTKRKYYEYNGEKTYVGEAEVTPSTTDVPYNTTENDEKPETLQKDGKTYQRVAVKAGSAAENGKVTGDHVVTYVYAE